MAVKPVCFPRLKRNVLKVSAIFQPKHCQNHLNLFFFCGDANGIVRLETFCRAAISFDALFREVFPLLKPAVHEVVWHVDTALPEAITIGSRCISPNGDLFLHEFS